MPKNKIQFQKGLSLPEFLARYSSEGQCRDALLKLRWPKKIVCPKCGHAACSVIQGR
ncbi:MAG: transposase [Desulfobulbus sp.]